MTAGSSGESAAYEAEATLLALPAMTQDEAWVVIQALTDFAEGAEEGAADLRRQDRELEAAALDEMTATARRLDRHLTDQLALR